MERKKILVIGSLNMDWVVKADHIPIIGETVLGSEFRKFAGGKGANQAVAAGRLAGTVSMLGAVGDDEDGKALLEKLKSAGIATENIRISEIRTGLAIITVDQRGNNCITVSMGANKDCTVDYIKENERIMEESDIVLIQMEIPHNAVYYAVSKAHDLHKMVILNPAPAPNEFPASIYEQIDYITPNETELQLLTGISSVSEKEEIERGCDMLIKKGVKNVIVTLGEKGALWAKENEKQYFGVPKIRAVDTTAAGDSFNAAMAVFLSEGNSVADAVKFANAAAGLAVQKKGAQDALPYREKVNQVLGLV